MTDLTEIYEGGTGAPRYVVRLSRTTTGTRTYTVGVSLNGADIADAVTDLFRLERAVINEIDGPRKSARQSGNGVAAQLRRSLIVEALRKGPKGAVFTMVKGPTGGNTLVSTTTMTTADLLEKLPDMRRPQLVADLSALVNAGVVEVEQSKGRTPSRYRLARKDGDA
jgi:hypothetical protein